MSKQAVPSILTIGALRQGYRNGSFTPVEVIEAIVERAEASVESRIWITPPALERIHPYLNDLEKLEPDQCPLWGIPFAVKDNIEVADWPITAACPDFAYTAERNAAVVERLIAAGAVPVGKANLDQFATGLVGTRSPYGGTHNALRPELISGGSSSGSAIAVARGQAAFSLGTDTAGSGRVPAALNGLVGYKPAVGAWPTEGVIPACRSLDCVTVFAHSIDDCLAVDQQARGYLASDPYSAARPLAHPVMPAVFLIPQGSLEFFGPFAALYEQAWERAKIMLNDTGCRVVETDISILLEASALLYEGPLVAERWADLETFVANHPGAALPVTEEILRTGAKADYSASALYRAQHRLAQIRRETEKLLRNAVLVLPTAGGTWTREQIEADPVATNLKMGLYTNHCNLLDLSAIAIPAGEADDKLPFGITLFSLANEEGNLGQAARAFLRQGESVTVAVCGLHMRGMALEQQMLGLGAVFMEETETAPVYEMYQLSTVPPKPGLVRARGEGTGSAISIELWKMPLDAFGRFTASIPAPLGIGKVELADGRAVPGFLCESHVADTERNISASGGWRNWLRSAYEDNLR
ncbi:allophanate hydrolase [Paenibacillus sp. GCM10012307]|uniref:Allophanate hydrolase n=1 Tax=Paenibacillus roseus TaxID=2798579 RepID=A0A934IZU2_9BACL|nr:allophanate hydrolase [Paenibacillus roseus]MBJ6360090.1 allophanate hydrolase [Paenibacillus roseus]